ncbi:tryptophan synthase beta chain [Longimycelium tulufanense]|uniref:Tryptophan synthase beta chain n=1 Tax=Longimycelium tulufanense TaxID=907463 RepID=A0A8J3FWU7_9PSEU|nr:TrpB-like pyridoxal phosphate-dependent enzyme [Longimycelium tulufanense]GGM80517.1 tryptophan synthase beta chain [Longimycelium tulufanense]
MKRIVLPHSDLPDRWYNIVADLPSRPAPYLHPQTLEPLGPEFFAPLLPQALIRQEFSTERWVEIPDRVREIYEIWRPSPLYRADRLERALDTSAKIYYKFEGVSPAGSHKPNTAIAQAYYNKLEGTKRLTTETGAGQWGSALAFAGSVFDLDVTVYMVKSSYHQKPYRRVMMETWGATVFPSPTDRTAAGRAILAEDPDSPGSLAMSISEATEEAAGRDDTKFAPGSVMNYVLMHQTVIGLEAKKQMELAGDYPDVVVACVGGGSNFGGFTYPFLQDRLAGRKPRTRFVAAEPDACPTLTRGKYAYDYPDTARTSPVMLMHTVGNTFMPPPIHAGGLRHHADAPSLCLLADQGHIEARAYSQGDVFTEAVRFARSEGFIIAPESSHALRAAVDEALAARVAGEPRTIVFNLSGVGHFDMGAFDDFLAGKLADYEPPDERIQECLTSLPQVPEPA